MRRTELLPLAVRYVPPLHAPGRARRFETDGGHEVLAVATTADRSTVIKGLHSTTVRGGDGRRRVALPPGVEGGEGEADGGGGTHGLAHVHGQKTEKGGRKANFKEMVTERCSKVIDPACSALSLHATCTLHAPPKITLPGGQG